MAARDFFLDDNDLRMEGEWRARERATARDMERLRETAPTADDLTAQYTEEDPYLVDRLGPDRAEGGFATGEDYSLNAALRMLQEQAGTQGFTGAERQMMDASSRQQAQMARSQRDALMQQAEARGMGGSGMSLVSSQLAGEQATQRQADFEAQMAMAAQQRALQAMQSLGQLGAQQYGESFQQDAYRRGAIDDFNRWQTEYRMGASERNAGRRDAQAEQRASGAQQAWENQYRAARDQQSDRAGYGNAISGEQRYQQDRDDARMQGAIDSATSLASGGGRGGR